MIYANIFTVNLKNVYTVLHRCMSHKNSPHGSFPNVSDMKSCWTLSINILK